MGAPAQASARSRGGQTRDKILRAATELFTDTGFDGASIDAIARRAGVQLSLVRYHFGSKEELWQAVVDDVYARVDALLDREMAALPEARGDEALRLFLRGYVRLLAEIPAYARLNVLEGARSNSRAEYIHRKYSRGHAKRFTKLVEATGIDRTLPRLPLARMAFLLVGAAQTPFVLSDKYRKLSGIDLSTEQAQAQHVEDLMRLFTGHG